MTLTGHSGGGSFMFGVIEAGDEIPDYVDRIASWTPTTLRRRKTRGKLRSWLKGDAARRLIVLAYDDREIMLDGKKVVGPTGGTFRATERMVEAFKQNFPLTEATTAKPPFIETRASTAASTSTSIRIRRTKSCTRCSSAT